MAVGTACWVVTDGAAGNENQVLALARALGFEPRVLRIDLRWPWRWLAPSTPRDFRSALVPSQRPSLAPPWPDFVIGCGRASALVTRGLRQQSGGRTRAIQILDPRRHRDDFDALVVPEHDAVRGDNVIACTGALTAIDDDWLAHGRAAFPAFGDLPTPRTAVLVGGPVRGFAMGAAYVDGLLATLSRWHARDGGSFLVTCSRRTPWTLADALRSFFANMPGTFRDHRDASPNPYAGLLGWAERIVVTPDSANLMSDACATGAPVIAHAPVAIPGKLGRLAAALRDSGRMRPLADDFSSWVYAPLRELPRVAAELASRFGLR